MQGNATIFIASDFVMDGALDSAAESLRQSGHRVVRGPKAIPGKKTVFSEQDRKAYFFEADVIVISTRVIVDEALLDSAPRLRGIVFPSIGTESIDMNWANQRRLIVANGATPENFISMSEASVMLMLNLSYGLRRTETLLRENLPRPPSMWAGMMRSKTVGLIGFGRIGRGVAERLSGWGVHIVAYDPGLPAHAVPAGVTMCELDELLAQSDFVSVHTTLTPGSKHLIGAPQLKLMKRSAFLINTARGACVDEEATAEALACGDIAGAALDAFNVEPLPPDSPLRSLDSAILTPHMVGHTQELFASFAPACVKNVEAILAGALPPLACNPAVADAWKQRLQELGPLA